MKETIKHECTVSWGMTMGGGDWIDEMIEDKKKDVELALQKCGFQVVSQHFIHECEWGTLHTWAELIDEGRYVYNDGIEIKYGKFYDDDDKPQLQVLDPVEPELPPNCTVEQMTVREIFVKETGEVARFLGCNEGELVDKMTQLFDKCTKLMESKNKL